MVTARREKQPPSFSVCKANALRKLAEADKSPKGCLDPHIAPLVRAINAHPDYVTTSSCAGRIVLWAEPARAEPSGAERGGGEAEAEYVGGRWLLCEHAHVSLPQVEALIPPEGEASTDATQVASTHQPAMRSRGDDRGMMWQVTLKHEPAILHVQCRDPGAAQLLLHLSLTSGFRESGIVLSGSRKVHVPAAARPRPSQPICHFSCMCIGDARRADDRPVPRAPRCRPRSRRAIYPRDHSDARRRQREVRRI